MPVDIDISDLRRITGVLKEKHGYDFHNYAASSFKRRILRVLEQRKLTIDSLLRQLSTQESFIDEFVGDIAVNVTEMFRDPGMWQMLKDDVLPALRQSRPLIRIWHAGCSTGEEVLSMSVILHELGYQASSTIVASDIDPKVIERAKAGKLAMKNMEINERNYEKIVSSNPLKTYYSISDSKATFHPNLLRNVTFVRHDLVTGNSLGEFDLVLCRNVMIYFNQSLQNDVMRKFESCLSPKGYFVIGSKESLIWCDSANNFEQIGNSDKVYRRMN